MTTETPTIFTSKQLADCARREAGYRKRVIGRLVAKSGPTKRLASRQIAMLLAMAAHFDQQALNEREIDQLHRLLPHAFGAGFECHKRGASLREGLDEIMERGAPP